MDIGKARAEIGFRLHQTYLRLGWAAAVAGALLALALLEFFSITLPTRESAADLEVQAVRLRESPRSGREIKRHSDNSPAAQIEAFERFLPPATDINRVVGEVLAAAEAEGLVLERGDYRLADETGLDVMRYQITLPVKGSYANIKNFVRRALRDVPSLALDGIALQRQNVGEAAIEAQIRLSIFLAGKR